MTNSRRGIQRGWRIALCLCAAMCTASCAALRHTSDERLPATHTVRLEQLLIHSDTVLPTRHRLFNDLTAQRGELVEKLQLPTSDEPIHIFLFGTSERFGEFMASDYPDLPTRRAFFVEADTRLNVYAHWGGRVAEDLRHEVAHGYLHAVIRNIPLWLDEGLAEYFEVPRGTSGINPPHVRLLASRLAQGGWRPDLRRLESLQTAAEMSQLDYAESWAWVHFLMETEPRRLELLRAQLQTLRRQGQAESLAAQIARNIPHAEKQLADHIFTLAEAK
ncbi:MAG: hypothetical protein AB7O62_08645 [Pirellulales bacterium]